MNAARERVWLFDLDDTLHDASAHVFPQIHHSMAAYIARHLGITLDAATRLRSHYWRRYGATLLGMMKHHAVSPSMLRRLPGRKIVYSNAPRHYADQG